MASAAPADMGGDEGLPPQPRDYEAEARQQGWRPKEEFQGDPDRWTDAETFARRADEVLPILKKRDRILKQENETLKRDLKATVARFETIEKRAYDRAMADLEKRQAEAVENGDLAGVKKATDDIRALERETAAPATPAASEQDVMEALIEFRETNPWYDKGGLERDYADLLAQKHADQAKKMAPADFFAMIGDKVREKYKDRLAVNDDDDDAPTPRRKVLSPVEGAGPRRPRGGKTGADLPPDAQKTADRFIRMGIIKTRDDYAKTYQWEK
jgi:hypothetical protein